MALKTKAECCGNGSDQQPGNRFSWKPLIYGLAVFLSVGVIFSAHPLSASIFAPQDGREICRIAARKAALKTGIPFEILFAISLAETGRKSGRELRSWPWTVNMEGKGIWFDSRTKARAYVDKSLARGARSFDIGCFQINYKWHGAEFTSIDQMFDPTVNALYAARYLLSLFAEKGDWLLAAGAYHSRTPKYATRYKKRFARLYKGLTGNGDLPKTAKAKFQALAKGNNYPLLQVKPNAVATQGSLVSLDAGQPENGLIWRDSRRLF